MSEECRRTASGTIVHRYRVLQERCLCGEVTIPAIQRAATEPMAVIDGIVAELVGPTWVGKSRQIELGALLTECRRQLEGP